MESAGSCFLAHIVRYTPGLVYSRHLHTGDSIPGHLYLVNSMTTSKTTCVLNQDFYFEINAAVMLAKQNSSL